MTGKSEKLAVTEAAASMETTPLNIMMHIKRGLLSGEEIEGTWYVSAASLASYLSDPNRGQHGSVCKSKSHCGQGCSSSCG